MQITRTTAYAALTTLAGVAAAATDGLTVLIEALTGVEPPLNAAPTTRAHLRLVPTQRQVARAEAMRRHPSHRPPGGRPPA